MARSATPLEHALESQLIMTQWTNAQQLERGYAPKMNCLVKFAVEQEETVTHMRFGLLQCKVICHRVGESESLGAAVHPLMQFILISKILIMIYDKIPYMKINEIILVTPYSRHSFKYFKLYEI